MLWFFALTEDSTAFRQYAEMLMVAVHTARKFTSLVPHFIYDGSDNDFTAWLRRHDVRIIRHRSLFRDSLAELGRQKGNPHFEAALSGAFSRVELPEIVARLGGADRVLYTDCDVIFAGEVVPELNSNPCRYFAVAPEGVQDDYVNMNTGVMLMNPARLRETLPRISCIHCAKFGRARKGILGRSGLSLVLSRQQWPALGQAAAGTKLEAILGRVCGGEDHPFPRTEAVSAGPYRIHLA